MIRPFALAIAAAALLLGAPLLGTGTAQAQVAVPDLAFLPPTVQPQELCTPQPVAQEPVLGGQEDEDLLPYLKRDIRSLSAEDPAKWFDFLMDLLRWQAELDPSFDGAGLALAQATLYLQAGRADDLKQAALLERLREGEWPLTDSQRVALARFYLNGLGVDQDVVYGQSLIREAAYGGNPDALLAIARMAARGEPMPDWEAPLDMTVTLAFGGLLGTMDAGICKRAERIAQIYDDGEVVARNPAIALAWRRFAADLGSADSAWRMVEAGLAGNPVMADGEAFRRYLALAARAGFEPTEEELQTLRARGLAAMAEDGSATDADRSRVAGLFQLDANLDALELSEEGPYFRYLKHLATFETSPGWVFRLLGEEAEIRKGRWAGQAEAIGYFEEAVKRGDGPAMRELAARLIRFRDDPRQLARVINLLTEAAERFGESDALSDLDSLYRCQVPDAPRLPEADQWYAAWKAADTASPDISIEDTVALSDYKDPWMAARIQTQGLQGNPQALARQFERLAQDPDSTIQALRLWADRTQQSDKALELVAIYEFFLSRSAAQRDAALDLFRRVYLHNGVTTALDLSVALVDDSARPTPIADEITDLLTRAGNRGEGASIRLLARLQARAGIKTEKEVFEQYADTIEERGDFLALMFSMPYIDREKADDYLDRAVSLMVCGTKDADELGDAYTLLADSGLAFQWKQIGLTFDGGNVLSRLDLQMRQFNAFNDGAPPTQSEVLQRQVAEGDRTAWQGLWAITSDPASPSYDPDAAAEHLLKAIDSGDASDESWVLRAWHGATPEVKDAISSRFDMRGMLERAAGQGDADAALDLGLLLRERAAGPDDVSAALHWLQAAAEGGNTEAMSELGWMLAAGLGGPAERETALRWLDDAGQTGDTRARDLARLLRLATASN